MKNTLRNLLVGLLKSPIRFLADNPELAPKLAWEIKQRNYAALDLRIPLTHGLHCPVIFEAAIYSFLETFISREWAPFLDVTPPPRRWLDIGCHCGYFSLFVAWQRRVMGLDENWEALLVDGDSRAVKHSHSLLEANELTRNARTLFGAISREEREVIFSQRSGMGSSTGHQDFPLERTVRVPVVKVEEITKALPPPYDVIKIDIEGGEVDFLLHYRDLLEGCPTLLLEWHTWNQDKLGREEISKLVVDAGFSKTQTLKPEGQIFIYGENHSYGVDHYSRNK